VQFLIQTVLLLCVSRCQFVYDKIHGVNSINFTSQIFILSANMLGILLNDFISFAVLWQSLVRVLKGIFPTLYSVKQT
jgi:hypothetical protein